MLAIEIDNLVKEYKNGVKALNGLSFNVMLEKFFLYLVLMVLVNLLL